MVFGNGDFSGTEIQTRSNEFLTVRSFHFRRKLSKKLFSFGGQRIKNNLLFNLMRTDNSKYLVKFADADIMVSRIRLKKLAVISNIHFTDVIELCIVAKCSQFTCVNLIYNSFKSLANIRNLGDSGIRGLSHTIKDCEVGKISSSIFHTDKVWGGLIGSIKKFRAADFAFTEKVFSYTLSHSFIRDRTYNTGVDFAAGTFNTDKSDLTGNAVAEIGAQDFIYILLGVVIGVCILDMDNKLLSRSAIKALYIGNLFGNVYTKNFVNGAEPTCDLGNRGLLNRNDGLLGHC